MAIILIDFDGTCVTHEFPRVGKDIGAVPILKQLVAAGHRLILFTMRSDLEGISPVTGKMEDGSLQDAINWFKENDILLYAINENPEQKEWTSSPKPYGQLIIDDSGIGCPLLFDSKISSRPYVDWNGIKYILIQMGLLNMYSTNK